MGPPKIGRCSECGLYLEVGPKSRSSFSWVGHSGLLLLTGGHCSDVVASTGLIALENITELKTNFGCNRQLKRTIVLKGRRR